MLAKCGRADEPDLFARPTGEDDSAPKFFWMLGVLPGQRRRQFHHPGNAGRVVVRAGMDFIFLAGAIERTAAAVAEMIVVRADHNVFITSRFRCRRQVRHDIRVAFLQMLDAAGERHFHLGQSEARFQRADFRCRARSAVLSRSVRSARAARLPFLPLIDAAMMPLAEFVPSFVRGRVHRHAVNSVR